jgi:hypothetical protein
MAVPWLEEEEILLRRMYTQGAPLKQIAHKLGRSVDAVAEHRRTMRLAPRPRSRPWSKSEDALLVNASRAGIPASAVGVRLGRPAEQARRRRARLLGSAPPPRPYSQAEDAEIKARWHEPEAPGALAAAFGRPVASVRERARKLGVHRTASRRRWTTHEDEALRAGYHDGLTCERIAQELGSRSASAVAARAAQLGLATYARRWTAAEDRRLSLLAERGTNLERAARQLDRRPEALRARARKLGIDGLRAGSGSRGGRSWTTGEEDLLRANAGANPAVLAELLERTPEAVVIRLRRLNLRAEMHRSPHGPIAARQQPTPGERAAIRRAVAAGGPRRRLAVAERLGRPPIEIERSGVRR